MAKPGFPAAMANINSNANGFLTIVRARDFFSIFLNVLFSPQPSEIK